MLNSKNWGHWIDSQQLNYVNKCFYLWNTGLETGMVTPPCSVAMPQHVPQSLQIPLEYTLSNIFVYYFSLYIE